MGTQEARDNLVIAGYQAGRQELLERIKMRETVTLSYIAGVAAIFGIELGTAAEQSILMVVPALALGATTLIAYHNLLIDAINEFFRSEVVPWYRNQHTDSAIPPLWDQLAPVYQPQKLILLLRFLADAVFLVLPTLYVVSRTWTAQVSSLWIWYASIVLLVIVAVLAASYYSMLSPTSGGRGVGEAIPTPKG